MGADAGKIGLLKKSIVRHTGRGNVIGKTTSKVGDTRLRSKNLFRQERHQVS